MTGLRTLYLRDEQEPYDQSGTAAGPESPGDDGRASYHQLEPDDSLTRGIGQVPDWTDGLGLVSEQHPDRTGRGRVELPSPDTRAWYAGADADGSSQAEGDRGVTSAWQEGSVSVEGPNGTMHEVRYRFTEGEGPALVMIHGSEASKVFDKQIDDPEFLPGRKKIVIDRYSYNPDSEGIAYLDEETDIDLATGKDLDRICEPLVGGRFNGEPDQGYRTRAIDQLTREQGLADHE